MCRLLGFFPRRGWPDPSRVDVVYDDVHPFPLCTPTYADESAQCRVNNVDARQTSSWADPASSRRVIALVTDVLIPGHRVTPVDPRTARQISFDHSGRVNWNTARPAPVALRRRVVNDGVTLALPPLRHYGHLLTDYILPIYFAIGVARAEIGNRLTVVTGRAPVPLVGAFIESLRVLGFEVDHIEGSVTETVFARRYLYTATHGGNREHLFAVPEAIPLARAALLGALGSPERTGPDARRVYLKRGAGRSRQVAGETELIELLRAAGFHIFEPAWDNLPDQIRLFSKAQVIVGVHGAGLANVLWAGPGTRLIELQANDARKTTGLHWASEVGASYHCIFGSDEGLHQSFSIDPSSTAKQILEASA